MMKLVAATLFCATLAVPAVAQGPHTTLAPQPGAMPAGSAAAEMMPMAGAVAAPVESAALYGGDMAGGKRDRAGAAVPAGPAPSIAWILALGFLALVVLRRTRSTSNAF
jgi:hypothetical protein